MHAQRPVASVLRDCDELEAVGPRYFAGALYPTYLANMVRRVYQLLGYLDVSVDAEKLRGLLGGEQFSRVRQNRKAVCGASWPRSAYPLT
jgi:hypothetical protein